MDWHCFISDDGDVIPASLPALSRKLDLEAMRATDVAHICRNLGFIAIRSGRAGVALHFRPRTVSWVAFAALNYWLCDKKPARIVLHVLEDGYPHEFYTSPLYAMRRMGALIEQLQQPNEGLCASRSLPLERLTSSTPLGTVLRRWAELGPSPDWHLLKPVLTTRYVVMEPDRASGKLIIQGAGAGLHIPDAKWASSQIGSPLDAMPDKAYARWVTEAYRGALARRQPQLEHVKSVISWPDTGVARSEYARLILPVASETGQIVLLGVSHAASGLRRGSHAA